MQDIQPISLPKKFLVYSQLALAPGLSQLFCSFLIFQFWQIRPDGFSTTQNAISIFEVISWILLLPVLIAWGCAVRSVQGKSQPIPLLAKPNAISVVGKFGIVIALVYFFSALGMSLALSKHLVLIFISGLLLILATGCTVVGIMGATRVLKD